MVKIHINGKLYKRNYKVRFCQLKGCGKRIQFRMNSKGEPETSDKHNKRKSCCTKHSHLIKAYAAIKSAIKPIRDAASLWLSKRLTTQ